MFKKNIFNNATNINVLKGTALIFDINRDPPTEYDINERIQSYPDEVDLAKRIAKDEYSKEKIKIGLSYIAGTAILCVLNMDFISAMGMAVIPSLFAPIIFESNIPSKNEELAKFIKKEKEMFTEISKEYHAEMLSFCKSSEACMNYKNKVVAQGRPLLMAEYNLFKSQVEKEKEDEIEKELYSNGKNKKKNSLIILFKLFPNYIFSFFLGSNSFSGNSFAKRKAFFISGVISNIR